MKTRLQAILFSLPLLATTGLAATVEERLDALEKKVNALTQENTALKKQLGYDAKGNAPATVTAMGKEAKLVIGGYTQVQAEFGDAPDSRFPDGDRFLLRRFRLGARATFAENFEMVLQGDFGNNSLATTAGYRAQLADGYIAWNKFPVATVTVGQFKVPYGYEQILGDTKVLTVERSLPNDQLTLPRQAGAMVAGTFLEKRLGYGVAFVNGNGTNNGGNDNDQFTSIARVYGTPLKIGGVTGSLGANAFRGYDTGTFTGHRTGTGIDAQVQYSRAELYGELLRTKFDRLTGTDFDSRGWSVLGAFALIPDKLKLTARYETYDPNTDVNLDQTNLRTLGLMYYIKGDDLKIAVNYLSGNYPGAPRHQDRLLTRIQLVY